VEFENIVPPEKRTPITVASGRLVVPDDPVICLIEGDGVGPEVTSVARVVLDKAIEETYGKRRNIAWLTLYAGKKAAKKNGEFLPADTLEAIRTYRLALKGPLETPVGSGIRSLNVIIRQTLNLYACVRPVRYLSGIPSPVKHPEKVDMVIFRENMEDLYAGVEWKEGSKEALSVIDFLRRELDTDIAPDSGVGLKTISRTRTKALVRTALDHAVAHGRRSVTLVTKGNIMKFTEGAFRAWGYEVAQEEYGDRVVTEQEIWDKYNGQPPEGKIVVKDRLADNMFQQVLLYPEQYDVIATPNLNGDYLSDALAAQVGGLGTAPGANLGNHMGVFEATHGTAPDIAGQGIVNPMACILSGALMLEYMGWPEAAQLIHKAVEATIIKRQATKDLAIQIDDAKELSTNGFGQAVLDNM
jgi:isocitrate dehydrogenase